MKLGQKELQELKGVGEVVSRRLLEAGYDTFGKIAAAGEDGLRKIKGINPRIIPSLLAQAGELAGQAGKSKALLVDELKGKAVALKLQVHDMAGTVRDRFKDELTGDAGRKVEKEILKVLSSLEKVEGKLQTNVKRAGKSLAKAEKRLADLADAGLKNIGKGLKKARKSLKKVYR